MDMIIFKTSKVKATSALATFLLLAWSAGFAGLRDHDQQTISPKNRVVAAGTGSASTITDADWTAMNSGEIYGTNGPVYAAVYYKKRLYIGGYFTAAGGILANNIAQWDGNTWSAIGSGVDSIVSTIAFDSSGNLYAGGFFLHADGISVNQIAKWDSGKWGPLGSGPNSILGHYRDYASFINAIVVDPSGNIYVGGEFKAINSIVVNNIARWNGTEWSALGTGVRPSNCVNALCLDYKGNLYAGGDFDTAGGIRACYIAKWDGNKWDSLQAGVSLNTATAPVFTLACDREDNLFVGGRFYFSGDTQADNIARWDGSQWHSLDRGLSTSQNGGGIYALTISTAGHLYAGGIFNHINGDTTTTDIAEWDGQQWRGLQHGFHGTEYFTSEFGKNYIKRIHAITINESGIIFAGGTFAAASGKKVNFLAQWNGNEWDSLGPGIPGPIKSPVHAVLSNHQGSIYVGGIFDGGMTRWNGIQWDALGLGIRGTVLSMCLDSSGNVYAGGIFDSAGGHKAKNIAKWDGTKWVALDLGLSPGPVKALACDPQGNLYAGGTISAAGRISVRSIAKWDGLEWDSLGPGLTKAGSGGEIHALAFDRNGDLFAGGEFLKSGTADYSNFAKWNGASWDSIEGWEWSSLHGIIGSLAFDAQNACCLSIGRQFAENREDMTKCDILRWDGSAFRSIGIMYGNTRSLAFDKNGNLYATGNFDSITYGSSFFKAQGIAKWNRNSWEAMGSGIKFDGKALAIEDSTLFVGGGFFTAGTQWSPFFAKVNIHN
jgi:trimeric autotransporter adhesin